MYEPCWFFHAVAPVPSEVRKGKDFLQGRQALVQMIEFKGTADLERGQLRVTYHQYARPIALNLLKHLRKRCQLKYQATLLPRQQRVYVCRLFSSQAASTPGNGFASTQCGLASPLGDGHTPTAHRDIGLLALTAHRVDRAKGRRVQGARLHTERALRVRFYVEQGQSEPQRK